MRTAVLRVGPAPLLRVWVAETPEEEARGLQGFVRLSDSEGMYFPSEPPGPMHIWMGEVLFPIDIIFFAQGRVARIVGPILPSNWSGNYSVYSYVDCSGVLEVRGGWCSAYGVRIGDPLIAGL